MNAYSMVKDQQGMNLRQRGVLLVASIVLLAFAAPSLADQLPAMASPRSPGCPTQTEPITGASDVLGVRMRTDDACRDAVRLMASFHACLRDGGADDACRAIAPGLRTDTTRLTTDVFGGLRPWGRDCPRSRGSPGAGWNGGRTPQGVGRPAADIDPAHRRHLHALVQTGGPTGNPLRPLMLDGQRIHRIRQTVLEKRSSARTRPGSSW